MSGAGEGTRFPGGGSKRLVGKPPPPREPGPPSAEPIVDIAALEAENRSLREKWEQQGAFFLQEIQTLRGRVAELERMLADTSGTLGSLAAQQVENRQKWQDFSVELAQEVVRSILGEFAEEGRLPMARWIDELMSRIHGPGRLTVRFHPLDREVFGFTPTPSEESPVRWIEDATLKRGQWAIEGAQWKAEVDWRPWVDEVFHEIRAMLGREALP